jgi:hypothetical protein
MSFVISAILLSVDNLCTSVTLPVETCSVKILQDFLFPRARFRHPERLDR